MQTLGGLSGHALERGLRDGRLPLCVGPYVYALQTDQSRVIDGIGLLYADIPLAAADDFVDYRIALRQRGIVSRLRRQVDFYFDHQRPFAPVHRDTAYASLEWGMNWCVSTGANEYLKLHAAVVARDGVALVMPGVPGAGKSTLCAALGLSGWRVLSDEHAMIVPGTADVIPLYRPVSLKNESIQAICSFAPDAVFGPLSRDTHKGTVAHLKADLDPASHDTRPLPARVMLFPKYAKGEPQRLSARSRTESFIVAAFHSFNYSLLAKTGFRAMQALLDAVQCYDLVYHDLDWALRNLDGLHRQVGAG